MRKNSQWGASAWLSLAVALALGAPVAASQNPIVDSLTADPAVVAPGETATVTVLAHDPDCAGVCTSGCGQYIVSGFTQWNVQEGGGSFGETNNGADISPYEASAVWSAPAEEGVYTVTVFLRDSGSTFGCGGPGMTTAELAIQVTSSTNEPPVIDSLTASPGQLFPAETTTLGCAATDPEGDAVTYSWSADSGELGSVSGGSATWSDTAPGLATITCTANDASGGVASASIVVSVTAAAAERALRSGLATPTRLDVDADGNLFVADRSAGGLVVLRLLDDERLSLLPFPAVRSVAVDWAQRLLVGFDRGAAVLNRRGETVLPLIALEPLSEIADVAVDPLNRRYGVLLRTAGRVVIFNDTGTQIAAFGSTGDGATQLRTPLGLSATPAGDWVVADTGHGLVKVFNGAGELLLSFGGLGGGAGKFVQLDDVEVDAAGVIWASDSFQSWIQSFNADGSLREVVGSHGSGVGEFKTATGITAADGLERLVAASLNGSSLQVFKRTPEPPQSGPRPTAALSDSSLAFSDQVVGSASAPQTLTLSNTGDGFLGFNGVRTHGDFQATSDCPPLLEPGGLCTLGVVFAPSAPGPRSGSLVLELGGAPATPGVVLLGSGFVPPVLRLEPPLLAFSDQRVATVSDPLDALLFNDGTVPATLDAMLVEGEFSQTNDCGATLAGGESCRISIRYAPLTVTDDATGSLRVTGNAPNGPALLLLSGAAVPGAPRLAIADVTATEGDSGTADAEFEVTLTVAHDREITVDYAAWSDTAAAEEDFEAVSGTLVFAPGETLGVIPVPIVGDEILEPDEETFTVELTNPVAAELDRDRATGTIVDDEVCLGPELLLAATLGATGEIEGWGGAPAGAWTLQGSAPDPAEGDDYLAGAGAAALGQRIDLAPFAGTLAAEELPLALTAHLRTVGGTATLRVEFRDAGDNLLGLFDSGAVASPAGWLDYAELVAAPLDSRWADVWLLADGPAPEDRAYFDAPSLRTVRTISITVAPAAAYEQELVAAFPVALACPYYREVRLDYATADGTASSGLDYLAGAGSVSFPVGETRDVVEVAVFEDDLDEGHETFELRLDNVSPSDVALLTPVVPGWVLDDDFCARGIGYWLRQAAWPVTALEIGGVLYGESGLRAILAYRGPDASFHLAAQLVATKLNLARGSDPWIASTVEAADLFLVEHPPGSLPAGGFRSPTGELEQALDDYNNPVCTEEGP